MAVRFDLPSSQLVCRVPATAEPFTLMIGFKFNTAHLDPREKMAFEQPSVMDGQRPRQATPRTDA